MEDGPIFSMVAAIAQETREVVEKLSTIMEDKEARVTEVSAIAVPIPRANGAETSLNVSYTPLYHELITKAQWARADFNKLAAKYSLMPVAVTDVINGWSDDALGDFLIEGNDPVTIRTDLIPKTP